MKPKQSSTQTLLRSFPLAKSPLSGRAGSLSSPMPAATTTIPRRMKKAASIRSPQETRAARLIALSGELGGSGPCR